MNRILVALLLAIAPFSAFSSTDLEEAVAAYKAGKHSEAMQTLQPLAQQGNSLAIYLVAVAHMTGRGAEKDTTLALSNFTTAAEAGLVNAQHDLGLIYGRGEMGVTKDISRALHWYRLAADQGDAESAYNIASIHYEGDGVQVDKPVACHWFETAAANELPEAQFALGWCYEFGEGFPANLEKARELYTAAAANGDRLGKERLEWLDRHGSR